MKYLYLIILFTISSPLFSQEKKYPTPDYDNTPFYYDDSKNELIELDAQQFVVGARPKGLTGAESALYIDGKSAKTKVSKDEPKFIVKIQAGVDPRTQMDLNLTKVNEHSGKREFVIYKKGAFTTEGTNPTVDISFKKIGDGIFLVTPKSTLQAGEYFFSLMANSKNRVVYCFSVN